MMQTVLVKGAGERQYKVPATDKYFIKVLSGKRPYGHHNLARLLQLCPKPRHVVDIGANLGQSSIEYLNCGWKVTAFEPCKSNYELAVENVAMNCLHAPFIIHNVALADTPGKMRMATRDNNVGMNYLILNKGGSRAANTESVDVVTLDSFNLGNVDIIKIDVEGFELFVLMGSVWTISRDRPIIQTELIDSHLKRSSCTAQEIQSFLHSMSYVRTLRDGRVIPGEHYVKIRNAGDSFWVPSEKL
jgi:FkbM family methyltransferase